MTERPSKGVGVASEFTFGEWLVQPSLNRISKGDEVVRLRPQLMDLLVCLAATPGQTVRREAILADVWPGQFIAETGLARCVGELRQALGDSAGLDSRYIETIAKRGYRLIAPVAPVPGAAPAPSPAAAADAGGAPPATVAPERAGAITDIAPATPVEAPKPASLPFARTLLRGRRWVAAAGLVTAALAVAVAWFLHDRRAPPPAAAGTTIRSIAVLPLANMSGDPGQEYFADGMTETLIAELSKIRSLKVISRTSVMRYKQTTKPVPEIARELGVDGVIEGSVLRDGDHVRITAQLIEAATDRHLSTDTFVREYRDVLALHSEVAGAIARRVRATLTPADTARLRATRRVDPAAHEAYLKARFLTEKFNGPDVLRAVEELQRAVARTPDDAMLHAELASCYFYLGVPLRRQHQGRSQDYLALSGREAARAAALDDSLAVAHSALATVLLFKDWDWAGAEREHRRAVELDPSAPGASGAYALYLVAAGRTAEAIERVQGAAALDPMNLATRTLHAEILYLGRQYARGLQEVDKVLDLDPAYARAISVKAWLCGEAGDMPCVLDMFDKGETPPAAAAALRRAYQSGGLPAFKRAYLAYWQEQWARQRATSWALAHAYARAGDREHDTQMVFLKVRQEFDFLAADPRFQELVARVGIPGA